MVVLVVGVEIVRPAISPALICRMISRIVISAQASRIFKISDQ